VQSDNLTFGCTSKDVSRTSTTALHFQGFTTKKRSRGLNSRHVFFDKQFSQQCFQTPPPPRPSPTPTSPLSGPPFPSSPLPLYSSSLSRSAPCNSRVPSGSSPQSASAGAFRRSIVPNRHCVVKSIATKTITARSDGNACDPSTRIHSHGEMHSPTSVTHMRRPYSRLICSTGRRCVSERAACA
jgi:hypothetical protein